MNFNEFLPWKQLPDDLLIALESETILDWSMGLLPWTFRRPILELFAKYFQKHPKIKHIHRIGRDAINFTKFPTEDLPDPNVINELAKFFSNYGDFVAEDLVKATFLRSQPLHDDNSPEFTDKCLRALTLLLVCQNLTTSLADDVPPESVRHLLLSLIAGFAPTGNLIPFAKARTIPVIIKAPHIRAFYFWRWQYVQRNAGYRKIQKSAEKILENDTIRKSIAPLDLSEYYMLPPLKTQPHLTNSVFGDDMKSFSWMEEKTHQLNLLTEQSRRKYNMFVAWPLQDYDSEDILNRIFRNEFNYWERPTPPCFLIDKPPNISSKQQTIFDELWIDYQDQRQIVFNPEEVDGLIYAEDLKDYYNLQHQYGKIFSHEIVQRIRLDTEHRAIGLCLWDSMQLHGCTRTEAIGKITSKYFESYDYDTAHFDRCLRTATAAIDRAEYLQTTNKNPKKLGRPRKKSTRKRRRKP